MPHCDSRDQDWGDCVCSVQLWIISTLFLLWPTWGSTHTSAGLFPGILSSYFPPHKSARGRVVVNLVLTENELSLLEIIRDKGDIHPMFTTTEYTVEEEMELKRRLRRRIPPFADCCRFTSKFHLPSSYPRDVVLHSLHGWLPSSLYFISFEISSVSFAPTQCGLPWILIPNGLACTWICLLCCSVGVVWNVLFILQPK